MNSLIKSIFSLGVLASIILMTTESCGTETYTQGKRLYTAYCANCHMDDGKGLAKLIPPLAQSDYLKNNKTEIPCIILHGQEGEVTVNGIEYDQIMPAQKYSEVQINNIINYINTAWGNDYGSQTITETKKALAECK